MRLLVDVDFWVTDEEELNCGRMDGEARRGTRGGALWEWEGDGL